MRRITCKSGELCYGRARVWVWGCLRSGENMYCWLHVATSCWSGRIKSSFRDWSSSWECYWGLLLPRPKGTKSSDGGRYYRAEGTKCKSYQKLVKAVQSGFSNNDEELKPFRVPEIKHDLSVVNGVVCWGTQVVVPIALQKHVVELSHPAHQGVSKVKHFSWTFCNHVLDHIRDQQNKDKMRNGLHPHKLQIGDSVIVKQTKANKLTPACNPIPLRITEV